METSQSEGLALEASYFGLCAGTEDKKEGTLGLPREAPATVSRSLTVEVGQRKSHINQESHQWQTKTFSQD